MLIQMAGAPGTGKSTLARALAPRLGAMIIDLDVLKTAALDGGASWDVAGATSYEGIYALTEHNLPLVPVIVDAPSYYEQIPRRLRAIAETHQQPHLFVECICTDPELIDQRLRSRKKLRSQLPSLDGLPPDAPPFTDADGHPQPIHDRQTLRPPDGIITVDTTPGSPVDIDQLLVRITNHQDL